jgi:hypothetical protein
VEEAGAILVGGLLPEEWSGADVPNVLSRDEAIAAARASGHVGGDEGIDAMQLDALQDGARWQAVWRLTASGGAVVTLDAITGAWLSTGIS